MGARAPGGGSAVAPLWVILPVTWVNSLATGVPFNGIFYIARDVYGFNTVLNSLLGIVMGVTYVAGALGAGPVIRWVLRRGMVGSPRGVMIWVILLLALSCALPVTVIYGMRPDVAKGEGVWSLWVFLSVYSFLCGGLWPLVESFLAGGRSAAELRGATGKFNITWSSALVFSFWLLALFNKEQRGYAIAVSAGMHLLSLIWVLRLPGVAGAHAHADHVPPPVYRKLLKGHRLLLPAAYLVMYTVLPMLPGITKVIMTAGGWEEKLAERVEPLLVSLYLIARVAAFFTLERWQGWHGKWITASLGTTLLLVGCGAVILSPRMDLGGAAVGPLVIGLLALGAGAATIYCGALYYALEVGAAEVDAGGMHEAMIGVGYVMGPVCSLVPAVVVGGGDAAFWTVGMVGALAGGAVLGVVRIARGEEQRQNSTATN